MKQFLYIAAPLGLMLSASCSQPSDIGSCTSATIQTSANIVAEDQKNSEGGYLLAIYDKNFAGYPSYPAKAVSNDSSLMCGTFVEFISDQPVNNFYEVKLWTAVHCLNEAYIQDLQIVLKNGAESITISGSDLVVENVDRMKRIRKNIGDRKKFDNFVTTYRQLRRPKPEEIIRFFKSNDGEKFAKDIRAYLREVEREQSEGSSLCFDDKPIASDPVKGQKVCFLHSDLAAYKAKIRVPIGNIDFVNTLVRQQRAKITGLSSELNALSKEWQGHFEDDAVLIMGGAQSECIKRFGSMNCPSAAAVYAGIQGQDESEVDDKAFANLGLAAALQRTLNFQATWNKLMDSINTDRIQFHMNLQALVTNLNPKNGTYAMIPAKDHSGNIFKPYGLVTYGKSSNLTYGAGDSGSIVSYGGAFPLAALSKVNNDDTSGGVPFRLPNRMVNNDKTNYDDGSSGDLMTGGNPVDGSVAGSTDQNQQQSKPASSDARGSGQVDETPQITQNGSVSGC